MAEEGTNGNDFLEPEQFYSYADAERELEIDVTEEEEEGEDDCDDGDYEEEEEEDEEDGIEDAEHGVLNDLDFMESGATEIQLCDKLSSYEALAEKKRKQLADRQGEESGKRIRQEEIYGESFDEIMETMKSGRRKRSRKLKKRGRRKGSKNKVNPEVTRMLGNATLHYACGRYTEAISLLKEVIRLAPNLPDPFHTLGLVYKALGDNEKALNCYMLAAKQMPKDASIWKQLLSLSMEQGKIVLAKHCLNRAMTMDPEDITLKFRCASLFINDGNYEKASKIYDEILKLCPDDVEAHKTAAKLHKTCGHVERSISILEGFLKEHESVADLLFVDLLASICMENKEYNRAVRHIEHARSIYCSSEEFPLNLRTKAGVCHVYLGNMDEAATLFRIFQTKNAKDHPGLITQIANSFVSVGRYESALKYYMMLDDDTGHHIGDLHLKVARCYISLTERAQAIKYLYKALCSLENNVEARLTLASLLLEEDKEDEAISVLSPPANSEAVADTSPDQSKPWWLNGKVKLKLANIYQSKMMSKEFADIIFPLVTETLLIENMRHKFKPKKRLPTSVYIERAKVMDALQTDSVLFQVRPIGKALELSKAARAKRVLQKRAATKEQKKAATLAAGMDWHSDNSDDDTPQQAPKEPPLPELLRDPQLILDLCKALASLEKYWEALEIVNLSLKLASNKLSAEIKEELRCFGAEIEHNITDPKHGHAYICRILQQHPDSVAAWNRYYKATSKHQSSKNSKFLRSMRAKHEKCVPPMLITGHHHTMDDRYQMAAANYLQAYKLQPENPLINLCVGSALINLACQFRLRNKHQCLAQGLSFLYNNLKLCGNSQEALYNIARAYHHIGLVSLAATYYEKVLATHQAHYPIQNLPYESSNQTKNLEPGYCNLRREAAHNLHLIYKSSGAVDLARQILKDHCTF